MDIICSFSPESYIAEDGDDWVFVNGDNQRRVSKADEPFLPVSYVAKFDWTPVNIQRLEQLNSEWEKNHDKSRVD